MGCSETAGWETVVNSVAVYVTFDLNGRRWADSLRVVKQDGQEQKRGFPW